MNLMCDHLRKEISHSLCLSNELARPAVRSSPWGATNRQIMVKSTSSFWSHQSVPWWVKKLVGTTLSSAVGHPGPSNHGTIPTSIGTVRSSRL
jgi:hypothetical protein